MNAVHRWEFDAAAGALAGMAHAGGKVYLVTFRQNGSTISAVLDTLELQPGISGLPYLDSMSTADNGQPLKARPNDYVGGDDDATLPGSGTPYYGYAMSSYVVLGTPRLTTQTGQPLMDGDLVVSSLDVKLANAGGVAVQVDNSLEAWAGYLRGRAAYVAPAPTPLACAEDGFPACAGGEEYAATDYAFTWFSSVDGTTVGTWPTVGAAFATTDDNGYGLCMPETEYVGDWVIGGGLYADANAYGYCRPRDVGVPVANPQDVSLSSSFSLYLPAVSADDIPTVTFDDEEDLWTFEQAVSGMRWLLQRTHNGDGPNWTMTLTRLEDAPASACPLPCETAETVVSDTRWPGESQAHEERSMSLTDAGSPTVAAPITDAVPYDQVSLHLPIGRRAGQYRATIAAYHWAPLTIASVDWAGQYHNRTRRV